MATIKKAKSGTTTAQTTKKPTSRKMSEAQLSALAHQKRGMGPVDSRYVKKAGPIMNELGDLNEDQVKQVKNYMNKSSTAEKIYQALPNVGRMFGKSAADVPSNKTGGVVKKKMKNGGSLSGLKASNKRVGPVDPNGAFTQVQERTLAGAKSTPKLTKDKQLGATKMTAKAGKKVSKKK
jgi:hypothetical protein